MSWCMEKILWSNSANLQQDNYNLDLNLTTVGQDLFPGILVDINVLPDPGISLHVINSRSVSGGRVK